MIFEGTLIGVGVLLIPGIAKALAESIRNVGGSLAPLLPWGKKDGGAS